MFHKERNTKAATRFGFRNQSSYQSSSNDGKNETNHVKNEPNVTKTKIHGDCEPKKINTKTKLVTLSTSVSSDGVNSCKKKKAAPSFFFSEQNSSTSNESNCFTSKITSSNANNNVRKHVSNSSVIHPAWNYSRSQVLNGTNLALENSRRSRSRDVRDGRKSCGSKERLKSRDQSLKSIRGISRSRDQSLVSSDQKVSTRNGEIVQTEIPSLKKPPGLITKQISHSAAKRYTDTTSDKREGSSDLLDCHELNSDLDFLKVKLNELKDLLSNGKTGNGGGVRPLEEENRTLLKENLQLKEKILNLESQLNSKKQEINELNKKLVASEKVCTSQNIDDACSQNFSSDSGKKNVPIIMTSSLVLQDSSDNIPVMANVLSMTSSAPKLLENIHSQAKHSTNGNFSEQILIDLSNQTSSENSAGNTKLKKPSQLPMKLPSRSFNDFKNVLNKTYIDLNTSSVAKTAQDKITFGYQTQNVVQPKHIIVPNTRSKRINK